MRCALLGLVIVMAACCGSAYAADYRQSFDLPPSGWVLYNQAKVDAGCLRLNPDAGTMRGEAWYGRQFSTRQFTADFQFRIGPQIDADGMTFGWVSHLSPALGETGSALGAYTARYSDRIVHGYDGYFVEIDTFNFLDDQGAPSPHVAVCRSFSDVERVQVATAHLSLQADHWYDMRVKVTPIDATSVNVRVWCDSTADGVIDVQKAPLLSSNLSDYQMNRGYFGFTGATAAFTEAHYVDNFHFKATLGGPQPPTSVVAQPKQATDDSDLTGRASPTRDPNGVIVSYRYRWDLSRDWGKTWTPKASGRALPRSATQVGDLWRVGARAVSGSEFSSWVYSNHVMIVPGASALAMTALAVPTRSGVTQITVSLSSAATVQATITNLAGRVIATLPERELPPGLTTVAWDGRRGNGTRTPSGRYLVRLRALTGSGVATNCIMPILR